MVTLEPAGVPLLLSSAFPHGSLQHRSRAVAHSSNHMSRSTTFTSHIVVRVGLACDSLPADESPETMQALPQEDETQVSEDGRTQQQPQIKPANQTGGQPKRQSPADQPSHQIHGWELGGMGNEDTLRFDAAHAVGIAALRTATDERKPSQLVSALVADGRLGHQTRTFCILQHMLQLLRFEGHAHSVPAPLRRPPVG